MAAARRPETRRRHTPGHPTGEHAIADEAETHRPPDEFSERSAAGRTGPLKSTEIEQEEDENNRRER
jgi:hypothetical protein